MIDLNFYILLFLTFIIHLVGTLSYSARIAGVRMRKIAISFAIFNILMLVSRLSNSFQGPLLAKRIEEDLKTGYIIIPSMDFRFILIASSVATLFGILLIPTFQRLFSKAIDKFSIERSIPKLLLHSFTKSGIRQLRESIALPKSQNFMISKWPKGLTLALAINVLGTAFWTIGVLSPYYASYLVPEMRLTASSLSSIINGVSTLLMFIIVDPFLSLLTDDAIDSNISDSIYRKSIVLFAGSRLLGTVVAQLFLIPSAQLIATVARIW
jgi:hypothetical protein